MAKYDIYPGVDENYNFPPQIRQTIVSYPEIKDTQERMTEAEEKLSQSYAELEAARIQVEMAELSLKELEEITLPAEVAKLEAADERAREELDKLDEKLEDVAHGSDIGEIREALEEAQSAIKGAKDLAESANKAANSASQAALEAAGIAASKGRVIIQEEEPTGDDRNSANIWIKPVENDPETEVEERAITYVYIEKDDEWIPTTSDELAQAAQNALDAREAAKQAQQRAETAISNAQSAQDAAEDAQRTANKASLDARDAFNEAVDAQARIQAKIESGSNLLINGSFEDGDIGWPKNGSHAGRSQIIEDSDAVTGDHVLELKPETTNAYPESDKVAVSEGHTLYARGWMKRLGGNGTVVRLLARPLDRWGTSITTLSMASMNAQDMPTDEWVLLEGEFEAPRETHYMQFAFHANGPTDSVYHCDDLQIVDVTEARRAQARAEEAISAVEDLSDSVDEEFTDIRTSVNGKNSITRSTDEPSGIGVVVGDLWVRVDSNEDAIAQWYWDGAEWTPTKIQNEMLESLDVHKLQVTGSAKIAEAVIEKLWVDGLSAHSIATSKLVVASGNLYRDPRLTEEVEWTEKYTINSTWEPGEGYAGGGSILLESRNGPDEDDDYEWPKVYAYDLAYNEEGEYERTAIVGGETYSISAWVRGHQAYVDGQCRIYVRWYDESSGYEWIAMSNSTVGRVEKDWTQVYVEFTAPEDANFMAIAFWQRDEGMRTRWSNISVRHTVGAIEIGDGAVTAPKLTVTEEMSAKIANFMTAKVKELIVSGGASINNAKLIGDTWAENLTVRKIIGNNGVFNGTVDANKINAGSFSGKIFTGGTFTGARFNAVDSAGYGMILVPKTGADNSAIYFSDDGSLSITQAAIWRNGYSKGKAAELELRGAHGADVRIADNLYVNKAMKGNSLESRSDIQVDGNSKLKRNLYVGGKVSGGKGSIFATNTDTDVIHIRNRLRTDGTTVVDTYGPTALHGSSLYFKNLPSGSSSGNVVCQNSNRRVYQNFSTRRVKKNIADWNPEVERVLKLQPRQWQHFDPEQPDNPNNVSELWHVGFVAEEVHDTGLHLLVQYGGDGKGGWRPEGLNYDRFAAAHQIVLRKHEKEISELRDENEDLKSRVERLEALVTQMVDSDRQNGSD